MPERKMGAAVGQDCALLEEVCGWINAKATVPVWAKMTPNITDITQVSFVTHILTSHNSYSNYYVNNFPVASVFIASQSCSEFGMRGSVCYKYNYERHGNQSRYITP